MLVSTAERRGRAHGHAAAPPVMCLVLPLCFRAANHSTGNKSCSDPARMAPRDKPHLGSRWEALLNWQESAVGNEGGFDSAGATPQEPGAQHKSEQGEFIHNLPPPEDLSLLQQRPPWRDKQYTHKLTLMSTTGPSASSPPSHQSPGRGRQMFPRGVWKVSSRSRKNQVPAYTTGQLFMDHQILALKTAGIKQQPVPGFVFTFCLHLIEQEQ